MGIDPDGQIGPLGLPLLAVTFTFTNSLDSDQDRHNVGPDLDPNCLTL